MIPRHISATKLVSATGHGPDWFSHKNVLEALGRRFSPNPIGHLALGHNIPPKDIMHHVLEKGFFSVCSYFKMMSGLNSDSQPVNTVWVACMSLSPMLFEL